MAIRPFDWRDLFTFHRWRGECLYLHSAWTLTRGPLSVPGVMLSGLTSIGGLITAVYQTENGGLPLIGQVMQLEGTPWAHLLFLTPQQAINITSLAGIHEHFANVVTPRGALRFLADLDEQSHAYEVLRQVGYVTYARQRIWRLPQSIGRETNKQHTGWRIAEEEDLLAIRSLYHSVVPPLVQQVEPAPAVPLRGLVYRADHTVLAYVEIRYGQRGIWIQPLFHPDLPNLRAVWSDLTRQIPYRFARPIYVCVRSYQAWLETILESLGAEAGPHQAVMVKHLSVTRRAVQSLALPLLESGQPEISAPFVNMENPR
ncbi:MAG: hypothetical protein NZ840_12435 [Anaerolineales bacterium]|nr:hypothetical protein [Anaerolineales bacterium]MDW8162843.1 hypothetical protein [Anaerolineales bacterium]